MKAAKAEAKVLVVVVVIIVVHFERVEDREEVEREICILTTRDLQNNGKERRG